MIDAKRKTLTITIWLCAVSVSHAFDLERSAVRFVEYDDAVIQRNISAGKPFFLMFSAQWCHWCKEFESKTLADRNVYTYLNNNFTNIFIDADIHSVPYQRYKATGLPFAVFLTPKGVVFYRYAGTVYADGFLTLLKKVHASMGAGRSTLINPTDVSDVEAYLPPTEWDQLSLQSFPAQFRDSVLDNIDNVNFGIGSGEKGIFPQTFLYLLTAKDTPTRSRAIRNIEATLHKAVKHLYDPIEGGFYRYAETRDWQIPHFEKMIDLNSGTMLLLYKMGSQKKASPLVDAADKTLRYLTSVLYDSQLGVFLSYQEADIEYYSLDEEKRKKTDAPLVSGKIFTARLALALNHLLGVLSYTKQYGLEEKILHSLDFFEKMVRSGQDVFHYYDIEKETWMGNSSLLNYVTLEHVFRAAALRFNQPHFVETADKILQKTYNNFYDKKKKIYIDGLTNDISSIEFHMKNNGYVAQSLISKMGANASLKSNIENDQLMYFSGMNKVLENRIWDAREWDFLEDYVPYLAAIDLYFKERNIAE